jgi:hypothetical protein
METKITHTPGQWRLRANPKWPFGIDIVDADDNIITTVKMWEYSTKDKTRADMLLRNPRNAVYEANARLIAAAPALLAACKCLLADLQGAYELLDGDVPGCWMKSHREAEAAIAKAEKGE